MKFVLYDKRSGQIIGRVECREDQIDGALTEWQGAIPGDAHHATHYVDLDTLQVVAGQRDFRSLDEAKRQRWEAMKATREDAFDAPLVTPHGTFDSDPVARGRIADAVLLAQTLQSLDLPSDIDFTLADNTVVTLTAAQMVAVGVMLGQKIQAAFARAREVRLLIQAATTNAAVDAVQW